MMFIGVMILLMSVRCSPPDQSPADVAQSVRSRRPRGWPWRDGPGYVFGPGYATDGRQFMPLGLAFSFFFVWVFSGLGSPAGMVRIMASKDTPTIRRSIFLLAGYNTFIYSAADRHLHLRPGPDRTCRRGIPTRSFRGWP